MAYLALAECVSFEADSMADLAAKKVGWRQKEDR